MKARGVPQWGLTPLWYTKWNKRPTDVEEKVELYRKYFFICEGKNTEVWYFKKFIHIRKSLGIHPLIDIRLMEKTGEDDSISNPKTLIEFAEKQKKSLKMILILSMIK